MLILRKKEFSGYQPTHGISYIDSAQVTQKLDNGFGQSIDHIDRAVDWAGEKPVIDKVSKKWRDRIKDYTRPIRQMREYRKKEQK